MTTDKPDLIGRLREERNTAVQSKTICYVDEQALLKVIQAIEIMREALSKIEVHLTYSAHTSFPINVRELDGTISQQRPKSNEGNAYDKAKEALDKIGEILK